MHRLMTGAARSTFQRVALLLAILIAWTAVLRVFEVSESRLPPPADVADYFRFMVTDGDLLRHSWVTLKEIGVGLVWGVGIGVLNALVLDRWQRMEAIIEPLIVIVQATPKISLAPLLVTWLGLGATPKVALVALVTFFPVMANSLGGLRSVPVELLDLAAMTGANRFQEYRRIRLVHALPSLLTGLKVSVSLSVTAAVVGEFIGATEGLGTLLALGQESANVLLLLVTLLVLGAIGLGGYLAVALAERVITPWSTPMSRRGPVPLEH